MDVQHVDATRDADGVALSGFARRCLLKHLCDCHDALALTMRGVASVSGDTAQAQRLRLIGAMLQEAAKLLEQAERLALDELI